MKNNTTYEHPSTHRPLMLACVAALAAALIASLPQPVHANPDVEPPPVPSVLQPPAGHQVFLVGHAVGTQQYFCKFSGAGFAWTQFGPQATLFKKNGKAIMTHFQSSNPFESPDHPVETGKARPTWQDSKDASAVWAAPVPNASVTVTPDAIPWLLLEVVGAQPGPTGGEAMTRASFIQRLNTTAGRAPATGCAEAADIGKKVLVPYTADYFFYEPTDDE